MANERQRMTYRMIANAMLAALYVLFSTVLTIRVPNVVEISLASLPVLLAGLAFGLPDALMVALCGSFLEQLMSAYGLSATTPLWMAPVLLQALCIGGLAALLRRRRWSRPALIVAVVLSEIVLTASNTAALYLDGYLMGYAVKALHLLLPARLLNGLCRTVLSCAVAVPLMPVLQRELFTASAPAEEDVAGDGATEQTEGEVER